MNADRQTSQECRLLDNLRKSILCSVCLYEYKSPKSLRCGHVFCGRCVESISARSRLCPLCRKKDPKSPRDASQVTCITDAIVEYLDRYARFRRSTPEVTPSCGSATIPSAVDDLKSESEDTLRIHPHMATKMGCLMSKELWEFDVAMYFEERRTFLCAMRQLRAVAKTDSIVVGCVGKTAFFMHCLPAEKILELSDVIAAPTRNVNMVVYYVHGSTSKCSSSPKVVLSLFSPCSPHADVTCTLVPTNRYMMSWVATYIKYIKEEEKLPVTLSVEVTDSVTEADSPTEMLQLLNAHKVNMPNVFAAIGPNSAEEYVDVANKFTMRYIHTFLKRFTEMGPTKKVQLIPQPYH